MPPPTVPLSGAARAASGRGSLAGERLGDYLLEDLIGAGGMAEVYRARDLALRRDVAIKVVTGALADDAAYVARFRVEARRAAALANPHVVPVYQAGEAALEGGRHVLYLVMPLLRESLAARLRRAGTLPHLEAARVALEVADGLQAAHAAGLVHRDVKPGNVLLDAEGRALLADFGVARTLPTEAPTDLRTRGRDDGGAGGEAPTWGRGVAVGTPEYMAPEQLRAAPVDRRADVYGLGAVLYEALTGRPPFGDGTPYEVAARALHARLVPPSSLVRDPEYPLALDGVLLAALARDPDERFATVAAFAAALRDALTAQVVAVGPRTRGARRAPRDGKAARGVPARRAVIAVLVALLLLGTGGVLGLLRQHAAPAGAGGLALGLPSGSGIIGGQAAATATASGGTPPTAAVPPAATVPHAGTPAAGTPAATATVTTPRGTPSPGASPTATALPAAPLAIVPTPLALAPANAKHCTATQTVHNGRDVAVGWAWQAPSVPGFSFKVDGKGAGGWPSKTLSIPARGSSTLVITSDCSHGHGTFAVVVQDTLGYEYAFDLTR